MIFGKLFRKSTATRSVVIVDPSLRRRAGHAYHASLAVEKAAAAVGFDTIILASLTAPFRLGWRFHRCLSRSIFARKDWSKAAYEVDAAVTGAEIARALGRQGGSVSAIVLPTCGQAQLRAVGTLIGEGLLPSTVAILGWLLLPPRWNAGLNAEDVGVQLDEYRDAIAAIETARGGRGTTWLCCETEALRDYYRDRLKGVEFHLSPAPSLAGASSLGGAMTPERGKGAAVTGGHPHFVLAGHATTSKGYELLPDALGEVLAADPAPTFTIHGVAEGSGNPAAKEILDRLSVIGPRVSVLRHSLTSEDYYALIRSADVLLLPYRLPDYRDRGSGVFNEAVRYRIPVVAPAGADFAREAISERRAVGMSEYSSSGLATAIAEASRDLATLSANCRAYPSIDDGGRPVSVLEDFLLLASGR
jgi:glycosyltransferase involved in cell wall biosynthesis